MPAPTGLLASFADLVAAIAAQDLPHRVAAPRVELPVRQPPVEGVITAIWSERAPTLQLVYVVARPVAWRDPILDAIARVNHALPQPGFGLDRADLALYFRLALPRRRGTDDLAAAAIGPALTTIIDAAAAFGPALAEVVAGARAADQVLRRAIAATGPAPFDWLAG